MDLKQWSYGGKIWLLHIVDHLTRFSASCVIRTKKKEVVIESIFKIWISIFGSAKKFIVDNGGEFDNEDYRSMCENVNINIVTTAAESPWSNGLVERHNGTLGSTVSKMMEDPKYSLQTAVAWAVAAKNSLKNVHGFSPNQLVFGRNPNFPALEINNLPALEGKTSSQVVADNLNALHYARQAYIKSESCEKLRRAMRHQVRSSTEVKYFTGDKVFYKRKSDDTWKRPGTVIGQESQQVLVKHRSTYVRMHPCRLRLKTEAIDSTVDVDIEDVKDPIHPATNQNEDKNLVDDDDDEEDEGDKVNDTDDLQDKNKEVTMEELNEDHENANSEAPSKEVQEKNKISTTRRDTMTVKKEIKIPKVKDVIQFKTKEGWKTGTMHSRAGKATGKYGNWVNIVNEDGSIHSLDWSNVEKWNTIESNTQEVLIAMNNNNKDEIQMAKEKELANWIENKVFTEVPANDQSCISTKWVITEKVIDKKRSIKARLVARGFEEFDRPVYTDSSTCSKESIRIMLSILSSKG